MEPPKKRRLLIVDLTQEPQTPPPEPVIEVQVPDHVVPPVFRPSATSIGELHMQAQRHIIALGAFYGRSLEDLLELDGRLWEQLDKALDAPSLSESREIVINTLDKTFTHLLTLWGKKKIDGPQTPENLEKRAKVAERVASMLEDKDNDAAAKKQKEKAKVLRAAAAKARAK